MKREKTSMGEVNSTINRKVRHSNQLIESPYAQEFSAHEIKLFEIATAGIFNDDKELIKNRSNKRYTLTSSQLATLLNTSVSVISHEIEKTAKRIMKKTIHLRKLLDDGSVEFEMINIIPYAKYKNGILEFDLNYAVIPYLIEINKNFTEFQLHNLLSMRSAYAIKLYKLAYQYRNIKSRVFEIIELKKQFGIPEKYAQYKDFKKNVIVPSINQINLLTDLNIDYKEIKLGRKVGSIEFIFSIKKCQQLDVIETTCKSDDKMSCLDWDKFTAFYKEIYEDIETYQKLSEFNDASQSKLIDLFKQDKYYAVLLAKYVVDKAKDVNPYLIKHGINGKYYITQKSADVLKEKIENKKNIEVRKSKKKMEEKAKQEKEYLHRSDIKHEYYKLPDEKKDLYLKHANNIFYKYTMHQEFFKSADELAISVYAVSNNSYYNKGTELHCKHVLNIDLSVYKDFS